MNIKDFKWTEKRFGTRFATILKNLIAVRKDSTETSLEYEDTQGNVTKLVTDSNFSSLLAKNGLIEVKWQELKDKRDAGKLTPGALYRITDYNCTTTQENTQSAGHQFDIVLLALSENKLAEEGWAMMHDGVTEFDDYDIYNITFTDDVTKQFYLKQGTGGYNVVDVETFKGVREVSDSIFDIMPDIETKTATMVVSSEDFINEIATEDFPYNYFQNSNLSAWKVWYCLDNDKSRFAWADDRDYVIENESNSKFYRSPNGDITTSEENLYCWDNSDSSLWTKAEKPKDGDAYYDDLGDYAGIIKKVGVDGHGVIYRLIDEWNNDVGYDFKNIVIYPGGKIGEGYLFTDYETDNSDVSLTGRVSDVIVKKTMNQNEYTQVIDIGIFAIGSLSTIRGTIIGSGTLAGAANYGSNFLVGYRIYEM